MTNTELSVPRGHATTGAKRLGRVAALVTAGALGASVVVGASPAPSAFATSVSSAHNGVVVDIARAIPASTPDTTITVLPGVTLTIDNTGIQLSLTKEAVTEVENVLGFGQSVASLVGAILNAAGVQGGPAIAAIVGAALGVGSAFLKLCTASDGSATFTVPFPWLGLPSCSGLSLVV